MTLVDRNRLWARLEAAVNGLAGPPPQPLLVVDVDAFDANAADLARRAAGKPIRLASKSIRVPALISRALAHDGFSGVLAYALPEAIHLVESGVTDDAVVAYPSVDRASMVHLTSSPKLAAHVTIMVDSVDHLDLVDSVRHSKAVQVKVCLDVDAGLRLAGQHIGPKRSPLFEAADVVDLARTVAQRPGFVLDGVMTYEGQVAGVPDDEPGQRARSLVVRRLKKASIEQLAQRRAEIAAGLHEVAELRFWNAGGSGSVESTVADPVVTEVAAGSGLLVPGLFDHYQSFEPRAAAFFASPVVRKPSHDVVTCFSGGWIASGPTGPSRAPTPWAPPGLSLTGLEGAGEVQTPLTGAPARTLRVGDLVWFRHAKSGELFEHGNDVHLLTGREFCDVVPTYRGAGLAFG